MCILSFFPHPHILPEATNPHSWISSCWHSCECYLQPGLLCGCTKDSGDTQAWYNYWNTNLSPQNPTVLWMCMKISLDANQSITLGSEGGKETEPNSSVDTDTAFSALRGWCGTLDTLFLNTSLPWMLFLLKKTVHTMEGLGVPFGRASWMLHIPVAFLP